MEVVVSQPTWCSASMSARARVAMFALSMFVMRCGDYFAGARTVVGGMWCLLVPRRGLTVAPIKYEYKQGSFVALPLRTSKFLSHCRM